MLKVSLTMLLEIIFCVYKSRILMNIAYLIIDNTNNIVIFYPFNERTSNKGHIALFRIT